MVVMGLGGQAVSSAHHIAVFPGNVWNAVQWPAQTCACAAHFCANITTHSDVPQAGPLPTAYLGIAGAETALRIGLQHAPPLRQDRLLARRGGAPEQGQRGAQPPLDVRALRRDCGLE